MRATIAVAALGCTLFLSACGIKGPLHLPPSSPPPTPAPAASPPAGSDGSPATDASSLDTPPSPPAHD